MVRSKDGEIDAKKSESKRKIVTEILCSVIQTAQSSAVQFIAVQSTTVQQSVVRPNTVHCSAVKSLSQRIEIKKERTERKARVWKVRSVVIVCPYLPHIVLNILLPNPQSPFLEKPFNPRERERERKKEKDKQRVKERKT